MNARRRNSLSEQRAAGFLISASAHLAAICSLMNAVCGNGASAARAAGAASSTAARPAVRRDIQHPPGEAFGRLTRTCILNRGRGGAEGLSPQTLLWAAE